MEIPLFAVHMPASVDKPLLETLHSGYIGQGKKVDEFEARLSERLGSSNVLTLNSGTSAIVLALRLAGVGPGDEVITTPMTCLATNEPVLEAGAVPVWADIDPRTGLIDALDVRRKVTYKTKAIIAVDWGGRHCNIEALTVWQNKTGRHIPIINDAAHGFGSTPLGADFICFSFQAIKHITTIDGGALVCAHPEDYRRGKLLRWYGIDRETDRKDLRCEEDVLEWGYKFHMNDVTATIGLAQLPYLDGIIKAQRDNARHYLSEIQATFDRPGAYYEGFEHAVGDVDADGFWLYTLLCRDADDRERFRLYMQGLGIQASRVHVRNDEHTLFHPYRRQLPGVDSFADREIAIPVHWRLTEMERDYIIRACNLYQRSPREIKVVQE